MRSETTWLFEMALLYVCFSR